MSSGEQNEIRYAAETIYRNAQRPSTSTFSNPSRYEMPRQHAHIDLLNFVNEDFIAGYMQDGHMSTVRRFFCLFVAFDLFFISLLWFICIMMNGDTILNALKVQVIHYSIQSSLFDIIFVAFIRFVFLMIFYGIFAINHWSVIAFTTTGSCAFLIGKVFYYNWMVSVQPIIQVLMIIVSCLLAWGEAWFLDCRVIPQEKNAQRFYRLLMSQDNERSPLLDSYLNAVCNIGASVTDGSVANFYSPMESAHNSDCDDDEDELYKNKGIADVREAYEILECTGWKVEKINANTGDRIQSIQRKKIGKIYRLTGQINLPAKILMEKLYYGIEHIPTWNPTVIESKIIKKIDDHTDIVYQLSAPGGGGLVGSREFVNLRCWYLIKNGNISQEVDTAATPEITPHKNQLKKSISVSQLNQKDDESSAMTSSTMSLSKSLGAKVFSVEDFQRNSTDNLSMKDAEDEMDEFVDSSETQADQNTDTRITMESNVQQRPNDDSCDKIYIVSGVSIKYDRPLINSSHTRGENLITCFAMRESVADPNICTFEWLMCLDLKVRIPRFALEKAYTGVMQEFMSHLRKHLESNITA